MSMEVGSEWANDRDKLVWVPTNNLYWIGAKLIKTNIWHIHRKSWSYRALEKHKSSDDSHETIQNHNFHVNGTLHQHRCEKPSQIFRDSIVAREAILKADRHVYFVFQRYERLDSTQPRLLFLDDLSGRILIKLRDDKREKNNQL